MIVTSENITSKQRSKLKSLAAKLSPVTQIGKGGVTDNLLKTLSDALDAHELIKVNILETADEDGVFVVVGGLIDMLCRNVVLNNPDSMQYFQKVLRLRGVIKELSKMGCQEGDTVSIGDVEFDFVP